MHFYWGAKEALYKAYGRRELDFREHIIIEPFDLNSPEGEMRGRITKGDFSANYQLKYRSVQDFVLVYAWELT